MAVTIEQFRRHLFESGILSEADLEAFLSTLPEDARPTDTESLARRLVKSEQLTAYQAKLIYAGKGKALNFGNYIVLDKLGQGGMGMVVKARHKMMQRLVAIKVLSPAVIKSKEAAARFDREVHAAARLTHPNIVAAFDAGETNGTPFLVLEYVPGSDLSALVKKSGPLGVGQALDCIIQAARGLEFAHQHKVIHRDIKPANLLLDTAGTVKILDMGLARLDADVTADDGLTGTGVVMGTVDYMAPEQAMNTKQADERSDIYSLGVSLWYILAGKPMYEGDSLISKLLAHRDKPIPELRKMRPDVSVDVETVFRKLVAKKPEARYQTATEVIRALEGCRSGSSVSSIVAAESLPGESLLDDLEQIANLSDTGEIMGRPPRSRTRKLTNSNSMNTAVLPGETRRGKRRKKGADWYLDKRIWAGGGLSLLMFVLLLVFWPAGESPAKSVARKSRTSRKSDVTTVPAATDASDTTPIEPNPVEPAADSSAARLKPGQTFDALALVDPAQHTRTGAWKKVDGAVLTPGAVGGILSLPVPPMAAYHIEAEVTRIEGDNGFLIGGTMQGKILGVQFEGIPWTAPQVRVSGIKGLDGQAPETNETRYDRRMFQNDRPARIVIDVTPRSVRATCDSRVIVDWKGDAARLNFTSQAWGHARPEFFIASTSATFKFTRLTITAVQDEPPPAPQIVMTPGHAIIEKLTSPDYIWSAPENLGPNVNSPSDEFFPTLSEDGLILIFTSSRDNNRCQYECRREKVSDPFGPAKKIEILDKPGAENKSWLSPDGLTLIFADGTPRDPEPFYGTADLFISTRKTRDAAWEPDKNLGPEINTNEAETYARLTPDGLTMYYVVLPGPRSPRGREIRRATRTSVNARWTHKESLRGDVESLVDDDAPQLLKDGRSFLFARGVGLQKNLYAAEPTADGSFAVTYINSPITDGFWLLGDGETLIYSSWKHRGLGQNDLFQVRRIPAQRSRSEQVITPADGAVDVLALIDVNQDTVHGKWRKNQGALETNQWVKNGRIQVPLAIEGSYELDLVISGNAKTPAADLLLSAGGQPFGVILSGYGNGDKSRLVSGIEPLDGKLLDNTANPSRSTKFGMESGRQYAVKVKVTVSGTLVAVRVTVDGSVVTDWQGALKRLGERAAWTLPRKNSIGFGGWSDGKRTIHSAQIKMLDGQARRLR